LIEEKEKGEEDTVHFDMCVCVLMTDFDCSFSFFLFHRRLMEEDDGALSEIEPDSVPNEVRDWLAMTFTRSMSTIKRRPSDKPKFKSVAQAIRAGIMVDRCVIYSFFFFFLLLL
jgi:hypothetical protein